MEDIAAHTRAIERCNQRGGRMLSLVDLYKAGTMPLDLAGFLLHRVSRGDSFITGAVAGGAGKTTVMCALVNAIPSGMPILHASDLKVITDGEDSPLSCYICHEIGQASYFSYLWGPELRAYFKLKKYRHVLASNLHADDLEQAKLQIIKQNRVTEKEFNSVNFYIFISSGITRQIKDVWYSLGDGMEHFHIFSGGKLRVSNHIDRDEHEIYMKFISDCAQSGVETIGDFRSELLEFREG